MSFTKRGTRDQIAFEVAGLADLERAGARVAHLEEVGETHLVTTTIADTSPSRDDSRALGHMLAAVHAPVDRHWGHKPTDYEPDSGFMGKAPLLFPQSPPASWGEFYATYRIAPYVEDSLANGSISSSDAHRIDRLCEKLTGGAWETDDEPSILHGDLWWGNVMFDSAGPILIDPASHTGHRESDLAQLSFFGATHLDQILAAYNEAFPLADGWRDRIGLHQLHIAIVHSAVFGSTYGRQTMSLVDTYV